MSPSPSARPRHALPASIAAIGPLLIALGGCTTGSSASFTQAPLLFAEQAAPADGAGAGQAATQEAPPPLPAAPDLGYIAIGGNAALPIAAVDALTGTVNAALAQASGGRASAPVSVRLSSANGVAVAASLPVASLALAAGPSAGSIDVKVLGGVAADVNLQVGGHAVSTAATAAISQVAAVLPAASAVLNASIAGQSASGAAVATAALVPPALSGATAPAIGAVSKALVTTQPLLAGVAAQPGMAGGSNLLVASAGNLVRICLLKGCR